MKRGDEDDGLWVLRLLCCIPCMLSLSCGNMVMILQVSRGDGWLMVLAGACVRLAPLVIPCILVMSVIGVV
jgi:hypothetical protein